MPRDRSMSDDLISDLGETEELASELDFSHHAYDPEHDNDDYDFDPMYRAPCFQVTFLPDVVRLIRDGEILEEFERSQLKKAADLSKPDVCLDMVAVFRKQGPEAFIAKFVKR